MDERRMLHKAGGAQRIVTTEAEKNAALADGWQLHKVTEEAPVAVSEPEPEADAEPIKPRKGRK